MKQFNWSKWSSISEIVSSLAILLTLFYLATQTKQNTEAVNANALQALFGGTQEELQFLAANPHLEQLRYKTNPSDEEAVQMTLALIMTMRSKEHQWLQYKNGIINKETLDTLFSPIARILSSPNGRKFWDTLGQVEFEPEFTNHVNQMLEGRLVYETSEFPQIYSD